MFVVVSVLVRRKYRFADTADIYRAKQIELEHMSVDDLKKYVLYVLSV